MGVGAWREVDLLQDLPRQGVCAVHQLHQAHAQHRHEEATPGGEREGDEDAAAGAAADDVGGLRGGGCGNG